MIKTREEALIILGFDANSNPSLAEIKRQYHHQSRLLHPDKNPSPHAHEQFIKLKSAIDYLLLPAEEATTELPNKDTIIITTAQLSEQGKFVFINFLNYRNEADFIVKSAEIFHQVNKIKILERNLKLPPNARELVLKLLLRNDQLLAVSASNHFFTQGQQTILTRHLVKNHQNRLVKHDLGQELLKLGLCNAAIALVDYHDGLKYFSDAWLADTYLVDYCNVWSAMGAISSLYGINKFYQAYTKFAASHYDLSTLPRVQTPSEQQALLAGVKSKTWLGYFNSFVKFDTYRHPLAFAAGLFFAQQNHYPFKKMIKDFDNNSQIIKRNQSKAY